MRSRIVAANWKMNLLRAEAIELVRGIRKEGSARVVIFPSFPLIPAVADLAGRIEVGGQDLHPEDKGAFTGDVSGAQLKDAGCSWVLCGHSERRQGHGEGDDLVARKIAAAQRHGLIPMVCVGETKDERKAGETFRVLERQVRSALDSLQGEFALAYEPVWAIGTGETATPEMAQEAHRFIRDLLGEDVPILYGGSATPDNAAGLIAQPDVDGFLVGGASLDPGKFLSIIRASG
ncbi:MAG TPA: triose-phosphate isomerase [Thermoanaerobaculia bacterium]|jgi:triosephosphate isomerase|nr:triose-phosphate isomerase [Thermoanaerobaculia bacterium]